MTEIEPCPKCGALPCDWTDNPHTAPSGDAERYRRTAIDVAASLAAAISLREKGGKAAKKAAASDRMFDQMLTDYRASLDRARAAISYRTPSARITGDKDRENPVEGAPTAPSGDVERAVMVCPQCEGEGGYPDGMDEAACHTECTRCGSNGWIVNQAAIAAMRPARGVELAETGAVIRLTPRLLLDRMLPSGAGLDDAPDSKIVAMYLSLGELRGLRGLIAALRQAGEG